MLSFKDICALVAITYFIAAVCTWAPVLATITH